MTSSPSSPLLGPIGQFVRDRVMHPANAAGGALAKLRTRAWSRAERLVLKFGDPLVRFRFASFDLSLPLSHRLPIYLHQCPHYNRNLGRIGKLMHERFPDLRAVDVGANVGDSVAVLRAQAHFPILCVEADPRFFDLLRQNAAQFPDVALVRAYLGEAPSEVAGRLNSAEGTGHVEVEPSPARTAAVETISIRTLCQVFAEYPSFASAKLVKIDTDGYDCKILRGAAPCLAKSKPVLFFEYDPYFLSRQGDDGLAVFRTLGELGYRDLLVYDNLGNLIGPARVDDEAGTKRIHDVHCDHRAGGRYVDLCAFHADDAAVFAAALSSEAGYFRGAADGHP